MAYKSNSYEWGNSINPTTERECWTKLKLDEAFISRVELEALLGEKKKNAVVTTVTEIESDDDDDEDEPTISTDKQPVEIVTDFLRGLKSHVFHVMSKEFGSTAFRNMQLDIVLTVPAVWSDKAKNLTYQAVEEAGFADNRGRIHMITEPEAAAIYTLKALETHAATERIRTGDHFVLCDAGGGTVVSI